jgi:hypothetical protein
MSLLASITHHRRLTGVSTLCLMLGLIMTAQAEEASTTGPALDTEAIQLDAAPTSSSDVGAGTPLSTDTALSEATVAPAAADSEEAGWIDGGHDYAARKANEMTQWVDNFFGNDERDLEQAESRLRLRTIYDWDQRLSNEVKFRLGGKVNLPQISDRLDLVFRGEEMDGMGERDSQQYDEDRVGLQLQVGNTEVEKHRFDLTMGVSSAGLRPGVKYVFQDAFARDMNFRFTQRIMHENDEGVYGISQFVLDKALSDRSLARSYTRLMRGEETDGLEWSTTLSYARAWNNERGRVGATWLYVGAEGQTEPYDYVSNYLVGVRFRRQAYRDFLFWEVEPSYNWRIDEPYFDRDGAWKVVLRLEFLLFDNPDPRDEERL